MGQIAFEVLCVALAILWMVQHGVDIVKDVPFAHLLSIAGPELLQRPIGDIFTVIAAILCIGVVRKALRIACEMQIRNDIYSQAVKLLASPNSTQANSHVFRFRCYGWQNLRELIDSFGEHAIKE